MSQQEQTIPQLPVGKANQPLPPVETKKSK